MNDYAFIITPSDELTEEEMDQLEKLSIDLYPAYAELYRKNRYYSTIKPQMVGLVTYGGKVVGTGKFLWRDVDARGTVLKLFGFGVLISKEHQGKKLGTQLIRLFIAEAKDQGGDILYCTTQSEGVKKLLLSLGFVKFTVAIEYTDSETGERVRQDDRAFAYELNAGTFKELAPIPMLYIGEGQI